jgi:activator of HSP90 ATPase
MKTKDIKQEVIFNCTPKEAYDAWMNGKLHGKMIGADAVIDPKVGGSFSIWDDYLVGKTLELHPDKLKIVQSWRDNSSGWPEGYFSKITLLFENYKDGQTKLHFTHTGIPEEFAASIEQGWTEYYWDKMKQYFAKS